MDEVGARQGQTYTAGEPRKVYQPTFKAMLGVALMVMITTISLLFASMQTGRAIPAILASIFVGILLAIRLRIRIAIDEDRIEYSGLFSRRTIRFSDIIHAGWMYEHGFSRDRFFGSLVYEVLSRKERIKINFRLFSIDQMSSLIRRLETLPATSDMADQSLRRAGVDSIESNSAQSTNTKVEK